MHLKGVGSGFIKKKIHVYLTEKAGRFRIKTMGDHQLTMKGQSDSPHLPPKNMVRVTPTKEKP